MAVPLFPHPVVQFWREAGPDAWFSKRPDFDELFRTRFLAAHESAVAGLLDGWNATATGSLALVLLLDQFPRHAFRGTPRMYATDPLARRHADHAIAEGQDLRVQAPLRVFFYLPFAHSEALDDQDRSVQLHERLGYTANARRHHDIIRRFGRFPHRNAILARGMTAEEQAYLDGGGFAG